jgi:hypothetical protein
MAVGRRWGATRLIATLDAVAAEFAAGAAKATKTQFSDVVYHHAPDATFMTFRITETTAEGATVREEVGVERYTFRDGRIAVKDVYRKGV